DGALSLGRVHHRERVRGELVLGVAGRRTVGAAVPPAVERQHAAMPREVRDLHLPVPRVDDRPRRQEEDGRLAGAVDLVPEPDAVALDVAGLVGISRARLLAGRRYLDSHPSIQSSSSRWPASTPPACSSMTPMLTVMTSDTSAAVGISMPSSRRGSSNASRSTPRHSACTRARRARMPSLFQATA